MLKQSVGSVVDSGRREQSGTAALYAFAAVCLVVCAALTWQVHAGSGLVELDHQWHGAFVAHRQPWLTVLAHAVTACGSVVLVSIAAVVACAVAFIRRDRVGGIVLAASVVVASLLVLVVKNTVGRARPPIADMLGASPHSYSFPSGHTAMSTVLYGVLTVVLCRHVAHGVGRWLLAVNAALLVVGVGLSRVYLGFHWLTDVLAGWALGGAIVTVAIVVLNSRKLDRRGVR